MYAYMYVTTYNSSVYSIQNKSVCNDVFILMQFCGICYFKFIFYNIIFVRYTCVVLWFFWYLPSAMPYNENRCCSKSLPQDEEDEFLNEK